MMFRYNFRNNYWSLLMRYLSIGLVVVISLFFSACGSSDSKAPVQEKSKLVAYVTDNENNQVDVIDVEKMELIKTLPTGHADAHTPDIVSQENGNVKLYISNRHEEYVDVVESKTNEITKTIPLSFCPRSMNTNTQTHLTEVASTDRSAAAVIDTRTDEVVATVGDVNLAVGTKCGHPYWLDDKDFVFIDRENRKIYTYKIEQNSTNPTVWNTQELNVLATPSPVHHILTPNVNGKRNYNATYFYGVAEGDSSHFPAILKLEYNKNSGMSIAETLELNTTGNSINEMGGHHLDFLKDGKTLYAGSKEGHLFVVDYSTTPMHIVKAIDAGKGAGHSIEMKHQNKAVVINHTDKFISLIDTVTHTKIKDIVVSQLPDSDVGQVQIQAHTQYHFSDDEKYFYMALTEEGKLIKVNLDTGAVTSADVGGKLTMSAFCKVQE